MADRDLRFLIGQSPEFLPWPLRAARVLVPRKPVEIPADLFHTHWHTIGKPGMGKSKLIEGVCLGMTQRQLGYTLIDPHGTSAKEILKSLVALGYFRKVKDAYDRFLYFEMKNDDWFPALNFLKQDKVPVEDIPDEVLKVFHRAWSELDRGSAQLDTLVLSAVSVAVANNLPLLSVLDIISDKKYRDELLKQVTNFATLSYFRHEYDELPKQTQVDYRQSTVRRFIQLMSRPVISYSLGQTENIWQPRRFMDNGSHVVMDMGDISNPEVQGLLGNFFTRSAERAAFTRVDLEPHQIRPHKLIIDEFQIFADRSSAAFENVISQARKYGLFLWLIHQSWNQAKELQGSLPNVWVDISFQIGAPDAEVMSKWFGTVDSSVIKAEALHERAQPVFMSFNDQYMLYAKQLMNLEKRHAMVKFSGQPSQIMETMTVPTLKPDPKELEEVKQEYRHRFFRRKEDITLVHELRRHNTGPSVTGGGFGV